MEIEVREITWVLIASWKGFCNAAEAEAVCSHRWSGQSVGHCRSLWATASTLQAAGAKPLLGQPREQQACVCSPEQQKWQMPHEQNNGRLEPGEGKGLIRQRNSAFLQELG